MSPPILLTTGAMYVDKSSHDDVCNNAQCLKWLKLRFDRSDKVENLTSSTRHRQVRFESAPPKILNPESKYLSHEDSIIWWTSNELEEIRKDAKLLCSQFWHHASQDCDLTVAHHKLIFLLASKLWALLKLSPTSPDQDLLKWCSCNDGRRGLERIVSKTYSSFRQNDICETRMLVLTEQKRQRDEDIVDPEKIAILSQSASRRSRTFALIMASADASVVAKWGETITFFLYHYLRQSWLYYWCQFKVIPQG